MAGIRELQEKQNEDHPQSECSHNLNLTIYNDAMVRKRSSIRVTKKRGSEWDVFLRSLAILYRLQQGPSAPNELILYACQTVREDIYPRSETAQKAAFKHDIAHVKNRLMAHLWFDKKDTKKYILVDPGPFGRLSLSADGLRGLALLSRDFGNKLGERAYIRAFIDEIIHRLDPGTRHSLGYQQDTISLGVKQFVDKSEIPSRIWETIQKSIEKRRKLSFRHLSPRSDDRSPAYHEVAPVRLIYQDGHWYLRAWSILRRSAGGEEIRGEPTYVRFRLNYIFDDEYLRLLPTVIPTPFRSPPRIPVHYLLKPELGRGEISHHFIQTTVIRHDDGSAEIQGFTEDVWEASRLLLGYGEGCIVLGGEEILQEVRRRVRNMAQNYGYLIE